GSLAARGAGRHLGRGGAVVSEQDFSYLDLLAGLGTQARDGAEERRGHFHRGLVGHNLRERLAALDDRAGLDQPANQFGLVNAFADFGQCEVHEGSPPDSRLFCQTASGLSRFFHDNRAQSALDVVRLWHGFLLVYVIQADARHMLTGHQTRTHQQIVEMFVDDAAQQVFAIVGHFRVLVDDQQTARLPYTGADGIPIVGKNTSQIEYVAMAPRLLRQLVSRLHT